MGSNSYANLRADYEEEHNEKISMIELWEQGHKRKDGTFLKDTVTEDFLTDAKARAEWLKNADADGSKSTIEIENEAFEVELNGIDDIHDQRPQGYGFGVKKSDVYGVRGLLRKEGYGKYGKKPLTVDDNARVNALNKKNEELEKKNKGLSKKVEENTKLTKKVLSQFPLLLDAIRDGKASTEHLDAAQTALYMANPEDHDDADDADDAEFETEDFPSSPGD